MADFDRDAEFRRNLNQLRAMYAAGDAFESVPLGGDALSRGDIAAARQAAADLKRFILQAKVEEKALARENLKARTAEQRLRLAQSPTGQSLTAQLRAEGFGTRGNAAKAGFLRSMSKGRLSLRGGLKGIGGGPLLTTAAVLTTIGIGLEAFADARDEYNAIKNAGGTDAQAKQALVGKARESLAKSVIGLTGAETLSVGLGRAFGLSHKDAQHRFERYYSEVFNNSAVQRRDLVAANAALNAENEVLEHWSKLDRSSPKTFRLRNKAEASAYQNERRTANDMELNRQLFVNSQKQQADKRDASGH